MIHIPKKSSDSISNLQSAAKPSKKIKTSIPSGILPKTPDIPSDKILKVNEIKNTRNPLKTVVAALKQLGRSIDNFMHPFNKKNINDLCDGINQARDLLLEAHTNFISVSKSPNVHVYIEAGKQLKKAGEQCLSIDQKLTKLMSKMSADEITQIEDKVILPVPFIDYEDLVGNIKVTEKMSKQVEIVRDSQPPQPKRKDLPPQFVAELKEMDLPIKDAKSNEEKFAVEYQNHLIELVTAHMEPYHNILIKGFTEYPLEIPAIAKAFTEVTDQFVEDNVPKRDEMIDYVTTEVIRRLHDELEYIPPVSAKSES